MSLCKDQLMHRTGQWAEITAHAVADPWPGFSFRGLAVAQSSSELSLVLAKYQLLSTPSVYRSKVNTHTSIPSTITPGCLPHAPAEDVYHYQELNSPSEVCTRVRIIPVIYQSSLKSISVSFATIFTSRHLRDITAVMSTPQTNYQPSTMETERDRRWDKTEGAPDATCKSGRQLTEISIALLNLNGDECAYIIV